MNCRQLAKVRDDSVITFLKKVKFASTTQIAKSIFRIKNGKGKANTRLKILADNKKVKRYRPDGYEFVYYLDEKSQKIDHWLQLTEVYISLEIIIRKYSWYEIEHWIPEISLKTIQPDVLFFLRNKERDTYKKFFIEIDRDGKLKNKMLEYETYVMSRDWFNEWWARKPGEKDYRFPKVIAITDHKNDILKRNKMGLFYPITLSEFVLNPLKIVGG